MPEDARMNVIYSRLLEAVLAHEAGPAARSRSHDSLADVIRLRHIMERLEIRTHPGWALQAVADQLAYDAGLVRLAGERGITIRSDAFDIPERGRAALEDALLAQGVDLTTQTQN